MLKLAMILPSSSTTGRAVMRLLWRRLTTTLVCSLARAICGAARPMLHSSRVLRAMAPMRCMFCAMNASRSLCVSTLMMLFSMFTTGRR